MYHTHRLLSSTSAMALAMALSQPIMAEEAAAPEAAPVQEMAVSAPAEEMGGHGMVQQISEPMPVPAAPVEAQPPSMPEVVAASQPMPQPEPPAVADYMAMPEPPLMPAEMAERRAEHERLMAMSAQERWEARATELNARYEDLRKRAAAEGMEMPEQAPWSQSPDWMQSGNRAMNRPWARGQGPGRTLMSDEERQARRQAMRQMGPDERQAYREKHYQEMRERAAAEGIEMPETPPWKQAPSIPPASDWDKYREHLASMSPEQREACMAMHSGPMAMPSMNMPQGFGFAPNQGYGASRMQGPGYGYGQGQGQGYGPGYYYGKMQGYNPGYMQGQGYGPGYGRGTGSGWGQQWQGYPQ